jgi:hypothetical protein
LSRFIIARSTSTTCTTFGATVSFQGIITGWTFF